MAGFLGASTGVRVVKTTEAGPAARLRQQLISNPAGKMCKEGEMGTLIVVIESGIPASGKVTK